MMDRKQNRNKSKQVQGRKYEVEIDGWFAEKIIKAGLRGEDLLTAYREGGFAGLEALLMVHNLAGIGGYREVEAVNDKLVAKRSLRGGSAVM